MRFGLTSTIRICHLITSHLSGSIYSHGVIFYLPFFKRVRSIRSKSDTFLIVLAVSVKIKIVQGLDQKKPAPQKGDGFLF
jgi:hypothetical protein